MKGNQENQPQCLLQLSSSLSINNDLNVADLNPYQAADVQVNRAKADHNFKRVSLEWRRITQNRWNKVKKTISRGGKQVWLGINWSGWDERSTGLRRNPYLNIYPTDHTNPTHTMG